MTARPMRDAYLSSAGLALLRNRSRTDPAKGPRPTATSRTGSTAAWTWSSGMKAVDGVKTGSA
jgi:hypothetical protein